MKTENNQTTVQEILAAYHDFLDNFETLFCRDEDMTYSSFEQGARLDLEAAIADPEQFDGDNWANRDNLLASYGRLKRLLGESEVSFPAEPQNTTTPPPNSPDKIEDFDI